MARSVYVAALEADTGKSVVALGVMELLAGRVGRVGFFRPVVGDGPGPDRLVELVRERYQLPADAGRDERRDVRRGARADRGRPDRRAGVPGGGAVPGGAAGLRRGAVRRQRLQPTCRRRPSSRSTCGSPTTSARPCSRWCPAGGSRPTRWSPRSGTRGTRWPPPASAVVAVVANRVDPRRDRRLPGPRCAADPDGDAPGVPGALRPGAGRADRRRGGRRGRRPGRRRRPGRAGPGRPRRGRRRGHPADRAGPPGRRRAGAHPGRPQRDRARHARRRRLAQLLRTSAACC